MHNCSRCQGQGEETYDEDGRMVTDTCYHCGGSGKVDDETNHHDQLFSVALSIGEVLENDYRKACNSDPDGDGYDLGAYENQMMPFDYFKCRVYDRAYDIARELSSRPMEDQLLLIAWNEMIPEIQEKPAKEETYPLLGLQLEATCLHCHHAITLTDSGSCFSCNRPVIHPDDAGNYTDDDIPF